MAQDPWRDRLAANARRVEVLADGEADGRCELEHGVDVCHASLRRMGCDASMVEVAHGRDGHILNVGRKTRVVPSALRRALRSRDGGCAFPGCSNHRYVDAHHNRHWTDGGETRLDNLVLLCRHHHRCVHEGGFQVQTRRNGFEFVSPNQRSLPASERLPAQNDSVLRKIRRGHDELGLRITSYTGMPTWMGERMDYGLAVAAVRRSIDATTRSS